MNAIINHSVTKYIVSRGYTKIYKTELVENLVLKITKIIFTVSDLSRRPRFIIITYMKKHNVIRSIEEMVKHNGRFVNDGLRIIFDIRDGKKNIIMVNQHRNGKYIGKQISLMTKYKPGNKTIHEVEYAYYNDDKNEPLCTVIYNMNKINTFNLNNKLIKRICLFDEFGKKYLILFLDSNRTIGKKYF